MIKEMSPVVRSLTAAAAEEHAALPGIDGDRQLRPFRVARLVEKFEKGLFHSPDWAIAYCNGKKYRLNGQHSANMLIGLNGSFPKGMSVTTRVFECDTEEELATLFDQFDAGWSVRNDTESIGVHKQTVPVLRDIKCNPVKKALAGIVWLLEQDGDIRFTSDDKRQLLYDHADYIAWAASLMGKSVTNKLGTSAAIFSTYSKNPELADDFWRSVRDESHASNDHPTRVLGKFLYGLATRAAGRGPSAKWDAKAIYSKCIHAWNAARGGSTTALTYYPNSPLPRPRG